MCGTDRRWDFLLKIIWIRESFMGVSGILAFNWFQKHSSLQLRLAMTTPLYILQFMEKVDVHFTHCEGLRCHIPWKTCFNFLFSLKKKKTFDKDYYKSPCKDYFSSSRLSSMLINSFKFFLIFYLIFSPLKYIFIPFILQGAICLMSNS